MSPAGTHVTFQSRKTYPEIETGVYESFAILTGNMLHQTMKVIFDYRELK